MAQYMFLLFDTEEFYDTVTPEAWQEAMKLHAALERSTTASTVKQGNGDPIVTDGPFIETKEALGGYYLLDCKDLDQALALAKVCPSNNIEVRPVMDTSADSTPPSA